EGDGSPDRLVVRGVSPAKPSWRPDSLAVAYVDAGGRAAVYDLGTGGLRTFDTRRCGGVTRAVAYAPRGRRLAVAGRSGLAPAELVQNGRLRLGPGLFRVRALAAQVAVSWR